MHLGSWLGGFCLPLLVTVRETRHLFLAGEKEVCSPEPPVSRTSPSSPHLPQLCRRQKSLGSSAAAEHCDRCGGGPVGRQEVPARHVYRSPLGLVASCWAQYLDSLLWPNVPITYTLLMADNMGTWLWNSRLPGRQWHWASGLEFPCLLSPWSLFFSQMGVPEQPQGPTAL